MTNNYLILFINFCIKTIIPTYCFPQLTKQLDNSVLFSTPINSYKTLKEGWFLITKLNVNPYDGVINHPPLLLTLLSSFVDMNNELLMNSLYAIVDTMLFYYTLQLNSKMTKSNKSLTWFYLLNPLILLSVFSKNTVLLTNFFVLMSVVNLISGAYNLALVQLSVASYLSVFPIYLIIPFINHIYQTKQQTISKSIIVFVISLILLSINSFNFDFVKVLNNCYTSVINFEKIQPNIGLWWYFFIEMFDFFHDFYIGVFNMYSFVFIIPFTFRFAKNSIFNIFISILWINFTKNYPTIGDLNLSTILIVTMGYQYLDKLRIPLLLSSIVMSVVLVLLVLFYYLWVNLSSGNSNFFYGVGLVYNMLIAWTMCDLIWAELKREWYENNKIEESRQDEIKLTQF